MDPSSPAKRRALAPLDANVNAMSPAPKLHSKMATSGSPLKSPIKSPLGLKRSLDVAIFDENSVVAKKQCQAPVTNPPTAPVSVSKPAHMPEHVPAAPAAAPTPAPAPAQTTGELDAKEGQSEQPQQPQAEEQPQPEAQHDEQQQQTSRHRSASPDTSSVFDNSAMDTSQNTTILTEPDLEQVRTLPPPRPRTAMTREQARQRARILRLKLGLANYKLQTGQEDVPLERLQMKPLPGREGQRRTLPKVTVQPPSSRDVPPERESEKTAKLERRQADAENSKQEQPQLPAEKATLPRTPEIETSCDDDEDATSAVCGGVASSLLSLARASSSVSASS